MLEHSDISAAQRSGWPGGAAGETRDTPETRREFAEEHSKEFLEFALAGDADVLEGFVEHYHWKYKSWLN